MSNIPSPSDVVVLGRLTQSTVWQPLFYWQDSYLTGKVRAVKGDMYAR